MDIQKVKVLSGIDLDIDDSVYLAVSLVFPEPAFTMEGVHITHHVVLHIDSVQEPGRREHGIVMADPHLVQIAKVNCLYHKPVFLKHAEANEINFMELTEMYEYITHVQVGPTVLAYYSGLPT